MKKMNYCYYHYFDCILRIQAKLAPILLLSWMDVCWHLSLLRHDITKQHYATTFKWMCFYLSGAKMTKLLLFVYLSHANLVRIEI